MIVLYFTTVLGIGFVAAFLFVSKFSFSGVSSIWLPVNLSEIQSPSIDSRSVQKVPLLCLSFYISID